MMRPMLTFCFAVVSAFAFWACFAERDLEGLPCDPSQSPSCAGGFNCVDGFCLSELPDWVPAQAPECLPVFECVARGDEEFGSENLEGYLESYGEDAACWNFAASAAACRDACLTTMESFAETWPTWPECGGRQAQVCADYLACQAAVDGESGLSIAEDQAPDFGPLGTCWYPDAGPAPVEDCPEFCGSALATLAAGNAGLNECAPFVPDAGPSPDGGT